MKTIEELKVFFDNDLMSDLKILEDERKKVVSKVVRLNILMVISLIISLLLFLIINFFALIPVIAVAIVWGILYSKSTKKYVSTFKTGVIGRLIKYIDPNLNYTPTASIPYNLYMGSKIFTRTPDRYRGDDYVAGKLGNTDIQFSELHSEYKTETRNSNGTTSTQWHTIFKGIFFIAVFNKKFNGATLVLPDTAQKMFGNFLGNVFQSMNKARGELIKMDDPEFERQFVIYGSDQVEARYILSTSLMRRILDYKAKNNKNIYLSFIDNQIFIAISYLKNLFEPKLFKTLIDFSIIKEYYEDLQIAIGIVEDLNLNTRIWG